MKKAFMGVRLRHLREERGMTQAALARALDLSPSYLNQIEHNQRPLTVPVLLKLNAVFGLDVQIFAEDDEARLVAELRAVLAGHGAGAALAEVRELAANMPQVARAILDLSRSAREAHERADALGARIGGEAAVGTPAPFEEVRDFFVARHNFLPAIEAAAERIVAEAALPVGRMAEGLTARLAAAHGVRIAEAERGTLRAWDGAARVLRLSPGTSPGQRAFQMATQLAFLECGAEIDALAARRRSARRRPTGWCGSGSPTISPGRF